MSQIMAHRGARNLWAENSCLGFRRTAGHGFDAIEFDLHLTDGGEIVVIHDPTLDRAFEELASFECRFTVDSFSLYVHDEDRGWQPTHQYALG